MQLAHEALALLLPDRRPRLKPHRARAVALGEPLPGLRQVVVCAPELGHKAGREARLLQHPCVFPGETARPSRVVGGDEAEALVSGSPRHADRTRHAEGLEHTVEFHWFAGIGPEDHVLIYDTTRQVIAVRFAASGLEPRPECTFDAEATVDRSQQPVIAEPPEKNFVSSDELAERFGQRPWALDD